MAVTDPAAPPRQRATMFLVPTDTPGFTRVRNVPVMGRAGDGWLSHGEIVLDACRVPASQRLGGEGGGFAAAQERLGPGRVHHCMRWIGICERAFELMCARGSSRRVEGEAQLADQPLFQATVPEGRLAQYLRRTLALEGPVRVEQFPGGHSNLTYLVTVGARELVLRRPPFGSTVKTAHDMGREFRVLSAIGPRFRKVPAVVAFCDDPSILGASFYLMQRVRGVILRSRVPEGVSLTPDTVSRLCAAIADTLVELHGIDYEAAGLADLGRPEGYAQRQVTGWTRRYQDAQTDAVADMDDVARWLAGHVPASGEASLLHNDYKHDNLVLDPGDPSRILAVLDWEMSTPGDPLM